MLPSEQSMLTKIASLMFLTGIEYFNYVEGMRVAYLECFSGISGDMMLGALLHAGVSQELLQRTVAALNIGAELRTRCVDRGGISATKVDVLVNGKLADQLQRSYEYAHSHSHGHSDAHDHI